MKIYITVTGLAQRYGTKILKEEMTLFLRKDPKNEYDKEAIAVYLPGLGKIGYVANSIHTKMGECYSAGRLYDKMGEEAQAKLLYKVEQSVICEVLLEDKATCPETNAEKNTETKPEEERILF